MQIRTISAFLAVYAVAHGIATQAAGQAETPSQLYGALFEDVQMQRVFPDGKTFVDAIPKDAPAIIVQRYQEENQEPGFDLSAFVAQNFTVPGPNKSGYHSVPGQDVCSHIDSLWSVLARKPDRADPRSSLLPLPYPYVVPGGRFNEIYYWDSYFTMLGLEESGRRDLALNMIRNFVSLITRYGHVPNGNRTYREDVATAKASARPPEEVYRNLRAAAESGWDFSSRWLKDGRTLATIRTADLVPVDLNSVMVQLERTLAKAYTAVRKPEKAAELNARAELREGAVRRYLWDPDMGVFTDYLWREGEPSGTVTAATLAPLFFGVATAAQAERVAEVIRASLLRPGGLATSTVTSGQQWDAPNGWAPMQWVAIEGLSDYGEIALAKTIAQRWMRKVITVYRATGKLMEKYDVADTSLVTGGGEYPTQDGFGWTNGVLRKLLALYPSAVAPRPGASWCVSSPANDNVPAARPAVAR